MATNDESSRSLAYLLPLGRHCKAASGRSSARKAPAGETRLARPLSRDPARAVASLSARGAPEDFQTFRCAAVAADAHPDNGQCLQIYLDLSSHPARRMERKSVTRRSHHLVRSGLLARRSGTGTDPAIQGLHPLATAAGSGKSGSLLAPLPGWN